VPWPHNPALSRSHGVSLTVGGLCVCVFVCVQVHGGLYVCMFVCVQVHEWLCGCMFMCVQVHEWLCGCMFMCMQMHGGLYVCMFVCVQVHGGLYVCMFVCVQVREWLCGCMFMCMQVHGGLYVYVFVCMQVHWGLCVYVFVCVGACRGQSQCLYLSPPKFLRQGLSLIQEFTYWARVAGSRHPPGSASSSLDHRQAPHAWLLTWLLGILVHGKHFTKWAISPAPRRAPSWWRGCAEYSGIINQLWPLSQ